MSSKVEGYNTFSSVHNFFFHPLHAKKELKIRALLSLITNIFLTAITGGLWLVPFSIVNRLDHKKIKEWSKSNSEKVQNATSNVFPGQNRSNVNKEPVNEEPTQPAKSETEVQTGQKQPVTERPYSQLGKEAIEFARDKLKEMIPKINDFKAHLFVKPSLSSEVLKKQPAKEIAELYTLYNLYNKKIQQLLNHYQKENLSPWKEEEMIGIIDRYIKVCYAISCLSLEDLGATTHLTGKQSYKAHAQALMSEDSYFLQTFLIIYDESTSLECGIFWKKDYHWAQTSSIIAEFKKDPSYKEAFYQEGTVQNSWRLLSNDFCDRLSLYTSSSALFDAGSADSYSQSWRGKSQIYRHDDKDTLTIFA